jgi:phosphoribosyl 1,2-cyclic phosphate phosphodiesterase
VQSEQTYFIHISHKLGFHKQVENELPKSVALAYDGLSITL